MLESSTRSTVVSPAVTGPLPVAPTVSTKLSVAVKAPSLTVTAMVAVPVAPAVGKTVTVRFVPLPPNTIFAFVTRAGLEEVPLKVRLLSGVSGSATVNGIAGVGVFTAVD